MVGITNKIMLAEMRRQQKLSQSIVDGQTAISTGITLNKPSDNALAWVQVSDIGRAQAALTGDELEPAPVAAERAHQKRLDDAVLADRGGELGKLLLRGTSRGHEGRVAMDRGFSPRHRCGDA